MKIEFGQPGRPSDHTFKNREKIKFKLEEEMKPDNEAHTDGWYTAHDYMQVWEKNGGGRICIMANGAEMYRQLSLDEQKKYCRLIAAAPDLLAACEEAKLIYQEKHQGGESYDRLCAAIKAAREGK